MFFVRRPSSFVRPVGVPDLSGSIARGFILVYAPVKLTAKTQRCSVSVARARVRCSCSCPLLVLVLVIVAVIALVIENVWVGELSPAPPTLRRGVWFGTTFGKGVVFQYPTANTESPISK
jgi:hypothetical protein